MRSLVEPLVSNGYTLEMTAERLGWLEPTDAGLPLEQLKEKYRQNGYLWLTRQEASLYAYLFWGAEYWVLRKQWADSSYLQAFARILENA